MELLLPLSFVALVWLMLVRPQKQRARQHHDLVASLEVGDEVVTIGGIVGRVVALQEQELRLEVAPGVEVRILRGAVNSRVGDEPQPRPPSDEGTE